ncbi:class I histocompatibility antigen, F10 alpha chain-like [Protopterus annectens]|uniref:class I histocompatibility antigen, F10 alpha chain-like n=1 Tax=Protopterus annectens TaxID=7888 RepID=UPI001CF95FD9|nr:class I histocompatibility antigen, F10 alpha chain-like [Protopterus annectens]
MTMTSLKELYMCFLCFNLLFQEVFSGKHVLRYIFTGISEGTKYPTFMAMGIIDDIHIYYYDSERNQVIPRPDWVDTFPDPEYWEEQAQTLGWEKQKFQSIMEHVKQKAGTLQGIHTLQMTHGCEMKEDETFRLFHEVSFDGEDFMSFSSDTRPSKPASRAAEIMQQKWYASSDCKDHWEMYLQQSCITRLKTYIKHSKWTLDSKEHPAIKIWSKQSSATLSTLSCLVTGFYPQEIDVNWVRNGNVVIRPEGSSGTLPNHDGTYQIKKWVQVNPYDGHTYSCLVKHSSIDQGIETTWKEEDGDPGTVFWIILGIITGCVCIFLMMLIGRGL